MLLLIKVYKFLNLKGVYLQENKQSVDEVADKVKDDFRRYKILEASLTQQRARIQENLIDCRKSLSAIEMLRENKVSILF